MTSRAESLALARCRVVNGWGPGAMCLANRTLVTSIPLASRPGQGGSFGNVMKPWFQCVVTHWKSGFMTF